MAVDWDKHVLGPLHDVFGEPVTYLPAVGAPFALEGVFDRANREVTMLDDAGTSTAYPVLGVRLSAFPAGVAPKQGDKVQVPSVNSTYIVRDAKADGHGEVRLLLNLVSAP